MYPNRLPLRVTIKDLQGFRVQGSMYPDSIYFRPSVSVPM